MNAARYGGLQLCTSILVRRSTRGGEEFKGWGDLMWGDLALRTDRGWWVLAAGMQGYSVRAINLKGYPGVLEGWGWSDRKEPRRVGAQIVN
eukprot:767414-Hanusia_phi.AAC.3